MIEDVTEGEHVNVPFPELVNLYRCSIGSHSFVGPFVEIQAGVTIGALCKIESHTFICSGVAIGDRVFVGHGVMFTNDLFPAIDAAPVMLYQTIVEDDVVIGSGATILPCRIGRGAVIGAGAVVVADVEPYTVVIGNPATWVHRFITHTLQERNEYFANRKRDHLQPIPRQRGGHN